MFAFSSNETKVATIKHDEGQNYVEVTSRSFGSFAVKVRDLCLEGSEPAESVITVTTASRISIDVLDMVQIGDGLTLRVTVFDASGLAFDEDHFKHMNLSVIFDAHLIEVTASETSPATYHIRGLSLGVASVVVSSTQRAGRVIQSSTKRIHVFPPLQVHPAELVLLPKSKFQVQWTGGPPFRADVEFAVNETRICSVNHEGMVLARELGTTVVWLSVSVYDSESGERNLFHAASVKVTVKQLDGIRLFSGSRHIIVGEELTVRVVGSNGETPFTYGSASITFSWSVVNSQSVRAAAVYENAHLTLEEEASFSARAIAKAAGQSRISVRVSHCPQHPELRSLTASVLITVVERLQLLSPSPLLLPLSSGFTVTTNLDHRSHSLLFRLLPCSNTSLLHVNEKTGRITSFDQPGSGFVLIHTTSADEEYYQEVMLHVIVKPVQQVQLLPVSPSLFHLTVGTVLQVAVKLRDDLGRVFHSHEGIQFQHHLNTLNVVSIKNTASNGSLSIHALRPGNAILMLSIAQSSLLRDFLPISVAQPIAPTSPLLHIGATATFSCPVVTGQVESTQPLSSFWSSENPAVLAIDSSSGKAEARGVGRTIVFHNDSHMFTHTSVSVQQVATVKIEETELKPVSNRNLDEPSTILPLELYAASGTVFNTSQKR